MKAASFLLFAVTAVAQTAGADQTGGVSGVVTDAVTHVPVRKATVSMNGVSVVGGSPSGQGVVTDAAGAFTFTNLKPGRYQLVCQQQNYPQARFGGVTKNIDIKAGETAGPMNVELIPGAVVMGHIVDEDGDPLSGCNVQIHPAGHPEQNVAMSGNSNSDEDGAYRMYLIPPGKYILAARCARAMFQPRPFSAGPEAPPRQGYPVQYYPLTADPKGAQVVELTPGAEKSGVDFQMRPSRVTQVHVAFSPGGADWRDSGPMMVRLMPLDPSQRDMGVFGAPDPKDGTFQFRQVFPGSYILVAFSNAGSGSGQIGAAQRVEVGDQPVALTIDLRHGIELSGRVEIDSSGNSTSQATLAQVNVRLVPQYQAGLPGPQSQVNDDGTLTLKGVIPAPWLVQANAPFGFVKSIWFGNTDVTDAPVDLSSGAGGNLRIVISTNTASIRGSAPAGEMVYAQRLDDPLPYRSNRGAGVDQSGQYKLDNLAPGKYRLVVTDSGSPMPEEGGQEVTVHEGETVMLDLKAQPAQ